MYVNTGTFVKYNGHMELLSQILVIILILITYVFAQLKSIFKKNRPLYGHTL